MASLLRSPGQALLVCLAALAPKAASGDDSCHGFDEMWGLCPGLSSCEDCTPVDCQFGDWGEWYDSFGHCTGLKFRERGIAVASNECGKPCDGSKIESVEHVPEDCLLVTRHCALSDWSAWSACGNSTGQVYRKRAVLSPPANGGEPCTGSTQETMPCGRKQDPKPCLLSDWEDWTSCSASCGTGRHTRMRRVVREASNGGQACEDVTLETKACSAAACQGKDCVIGEWSDWSMCDAEAHPQRFRKRQVMENAVGIGKRCNQTLKETQGCPAPVQEPCQLSEWSEWSALGWREPNPPKCSKECGGGQAFRTRVMQSPPRHGGSCPSSSMRELKACNVFPCMVACDFAEWSEWSVCSAECGKGTTTRSRQIANPEALHSQGCQGPMEEARPCLGKSGVCAHTDCQWGEWNDWATCTASCGGGLMHRNRVIKALPENGGAACDALTKSEASPCNTHPCGKECVDGLWGQWQDWGACTATCGGAYAVRRRAMEREPDACGRPASGLRREYKACEQAPCSADTDCQLSDWSEWSFCSGTCFGVHERNRFIKVFPSGNGKHCDMVSLKETGPCNPGPAEATPGACQLAGPTDCRLSLWSDWSVCTKSCDGGQRDRKRKVLDLPSNGGKPCDAELTITAPCNSDACVQQTCQDCTWADWSEWGECSGCIGERYRHRSISQMPNHCGRMCDLKSAKEVEKCSGHCEASLFCAWTAWSASTGCGVGCGQGTAMQSRALSLTTSSKDALFQADNGARCQGAQLNLSACSASTPCTPPCIPLDCKFDTWSEWSQPTAAGLCERQRDIVAQSNECGKPCQGAMSETKRCVAANPNRRDCVLSNWTAWTSCKMNGKQGQKYRERNIVQVPSFDGTPCQGTLHETMQCNPITPKNCMLSEWGDWAACEKSCGGGLRSRKRGILEPAEHGGQPCQDSLDEMRTCNTQTCLTNSKDCAYSEWSSWSGCGADGQRYRRRDISAMALGIGAACGGGLEETEACVDAGEVDCVVSEWTTWDGCDKTCGGGQTRRQRQIMVFPTAGGKACPSELISIAGCNAAPCDVQDCQVSDWQEWSQCSSSCGAAQRQRSREVLRSRGLDGEGCNLHLSELSKCELAVCPKDDCQWGEWGDWSACSRKCGGGQQNRDRSIAQMPLHGGLQCQARDKEEVRACNSHSCAAPSCEDGLWADWSAWSGCSASCGGGTSWRSRQVARMANKCGTPVSGDSRETSVCNADISCEPDIDCVFGDWGVWSACSQTCAGIMRRSRRIERYGAGKGATCQGHLKEVSPCNPVPGGGPGPCELAKEPPVDCQLAAWSAWSACTATCGGGAHTRSREIVTAAAHGGLACTGPLSEARSCAAAACQGPAPVDCAYGEWQDWGACAKCDGERSRFRHITVYAQHGGKQCEPFEAEEASACPRQCHEKMYCAWSDWAAWGDCTAKCGEGRRSRRRSLGLTSVPSAPPGPMKEMMGLYSQLQLESQSMQVSQKQELLLAFASGFLSFVVALVGVRVLVTARSRSREPRDLQPGSASVRRPQGVPDYQHLQEGRAAEPLVLAA